jgi:hypothetical protein
MQLVPRYGEDVPTAATAGHHQFIERLNRDRDVEAGLQVTHLAVHVYEFSCARLRI